MKLTWNCKKKQTLWTRLTNLWRKSVNQVGREKEKVSKYRNVGGANDFQVESQFHSQSKATEQHKQQQKNETANKNQEYVITFNNK